MSNQASLGDISDSVESSSSLDGEETKETEGWTSEKIGDIFDGIKSGGTPKRGKDKYWEGGDIPFVKIEDLNRQQGDGISDAKEYTTQQAIEDGKTRIYDPGTILLTIYGTLGETGIVTAPVSTNQGIIGLWDPKDTNIQFARYALDFEQDRLASKKRETTQANIGKNILKLHEIPHPPKSEQRRIASVLYNVDQAISKTEEIIEQTQRVKKGLMQDLMNEGIDGRELKEVRIGPKTFELPENWEKKQMLEVSTEIRNGFVGTATPYYEEGGIPYLQSFNVRPNKIDSEDEMVEISEEFHEDNQDTRIYEGNMLTVQSGHIGESAIVPERYDNANCHALIITRFDEKEVYPEYVAYFMNSEIGRSLIKSVSVGTTVKHLNTSDLRKFEMPIPPLKEQKRIAEILSTYENQIRTYKEEKEQLQSLKKGLMQDLLTGSVRTSEGVEVLDEVVEV
ncbi:Type I restriction enzyme, S subunit [Candidatus Nanohalovita haloferacivicina]|nr:Type I restriction enzyme, S subunit [Candidatus Nanohalobia archaeon BNXNv]